MGWIAFCVIRVSFRALIPTQRNYEDSTRFFVVKWYGGQKFLHNQNVSLEMHACLILALK